MSQTSLSKRGFNLGNNPARVDMELFLEAAQNTYHRTDNPEGAFVLNVAENLPMSRLIKKKLTSIFQSSEMPEWVMKYTHPLGHSSAREAVAMFMSSRFKSEKITADTIFFSAGAAATLEVASFVLCAAGDTMVIPAPAYPVYTKDFGIKSGLQRYDLITHTHIKGRSNLALTNVEKLEKTYQKLKAEGKNWTLLVLTSPDNPTGSIYTKEEYSAIAKWCHEKQIHLLVNEIYACSLIDYNQPDIEGDYVDVQPFESFAQVMAKLQSPYLHLNYALSKDFASSGMRFGIFHTLNDEALQAVANTNIPHMVSNLTQWAYEELFKDTTFCNNYLHTLQKELTDQYLVVIRVLKALGIPYSPARGSLFVWADFSQYLTENTAAAEEAFWISCFRESKILLTPGTGFGHNKYGLFRIVFSAVEKDDLEVAMNRLKGWLEGL